MIEFEFKLGIANIILNNIYRKLLYNEIKNYDELVDTIANLKIAQDLIDEQIKELTKNLLKGLK